MKTEIHPDYKQRELGFVALLVFHASREWVKGTCQEMKQWNTTIRGVNFRHEMQLFYWFSRGLPPGIHQSYFENVPRHPQVLKQSASSYFLLVYDP